MDTSTSKSETDPDDILVSSLVCIKRSAQSFSDMRASQAAAALAYYAFFSLFPLILVMIAGGSYFLDRQEIFNDVLGVVQREVPVANELLAENLRRVLAARGTVGVVGLLALLWSASGFFTNLAFNINLAWPRAPRRSYLEKRLVGLGMIGALGMLMLMALALEWLIALLPVLQEGSSFLSAFGLAHFVPTATSWLVIFVLFVALYRWIPTRGLTWKATLWGAAVGAIGWKAATAGFTWYLASGLGRYQLIYGSLGVVVALLVLLYVIGAVALFGAHLCAAIDGEIDRAEGAESTEGVSA